MCACGHSDLHSQTLLNYRDYAPGRLQAALHMSMQLSCRFVALMHEHALKH
jgi:hypothetical protein